MTDTEPAAYPTELIDMRIDVVVRIALLGLGIGVVAWALTAGLNTFAVRPISCDNQTLKTICDDSEAFSGNIALILTGIAGILGLVRMGVYRPMLIAIAVGACLWGLGGWLASVVWYEAMGWTALIYMIAYTAFAWLVRPRNLIIVLISLIVVIATSRVVATL